MKSPSNNEDIIKPEHVSTIQTVNDALNHSVNSLTKNTLTDIANVRERALNNKKVKTSLSNLIFNSFSQFIFNPKLQVGVPIVAAIFIAIWIRQSRIEALPELPVAMMEANVPTEDFAMLEDLEFVTWLAENEQNTL